MGYMGTTRVESCRNGADIHPKTNMESKNSAKHDDCPCKSVSYMVCHDSFN